ncbi:MAG: xanthine dehydrogenase family protein molybdopterin-binding subunit [Actinobacteria bacterium]|nr:xanthine dehydrogenase family protein molybdopterin-binding subunit [Actinomycetota bacterium]
MAATDAHPRLDAASKAAGESIYVADIELPNMAHAAVARSGYAHALIRSIDTSAAEQMPGVVGVFRASDLAAGLYGRAVRDIPVLAAEKVRFVGEPVVAVVAETRVQAEQAAALVEIDYEELPAATTATAAVASGAPLVHDAPWEYPGAFVKPEEGHNLQSLNTVGDKETVEAALAASAFVVDEVYRTQTQHQGYLEPHACIASWQEGRLHVWLASKSPYPLKGQICACLGIEPDQLVIEPITLGADFGGKGSPMDAPLCSELSRLTGRPVKLVLRYTEDLTATDSRHPSIFRVRMGADAEGHLTAVAYDVLLDGGAYGGYKPSPHVVVHGAVEPGCYRIPNFYVECRTAYTHTVPKGHMRSPGEPQQLFATESAMDELALKVGIDPVEMRKRNILVTGDTDAGGRQWLEYRSTETLNAALAAMEDHSHEVPEGWLFGRGIAAYGRTSVSFGSTTICLIPLPGERLRAEVSYVETGTGSHTMVRELIGRELDYSPDEIEVVQVSTDRLAYDFGAGGSRVTTVASYAIDAAVKAWRGRLSDEAVEVTIDESAAPPVGAFIIQIAEVAVDPVTGQLKVLEIISAVDVAEIINDKAHQMQIDGGVVMGYGYACLEDLMEDDGHVWASTLGEYKLPTSHDAPHLRTVLVPGGRGHGTANVKGIGESLTPPVAAAIANAVADATGTRVRRLPLTSEAIFDALAGTVS